MQDTCIYLWKINFPESAGPGPEHSTAVTMGLWSSFWPLSTPQANLKWLVLPASIVLASGKQILASSLTCSRLGIGDSVNPGTVQHGCLQRQMMGEDGWTLCNNEGNS